MTEHRAELADVDQVRNHWWPRPGWQPGRLFYTWHLTFDTADQLTQLVQRYQRRLTVLPGLDLIPPRWLHLTMQGIGYTDDVDDTLVAAIVQAVAKRLADFPAFDLTFHRPVVLTEAIVLPPRPAEPVHELRHAIRDAIASVVGTQQVHTGPEQARGFRPHVSLAYVNTPGPAQPYKAALGGIDAEPATVRITHTALIVQNRVLDPEWVYRWTTHAAIRLRGTPGDCVISDDP